MTTPAQTDAGGLASLFRFPANWAERAPPRVVIAGGMSRSGTTYLEATLQSHPQVLAAQEFMPLKTTLLTDFFAFLKQCTEYEGQMWRDGQGRHWRGYPDSQDPGRMATLFLTCLMSTTRADWIDGKRPEDVKAVYCKTPGAEFNLPKLRDALPAIDFRYLHSVRDPVASLRSNWEMPWVTLDDPSACVNAFAETLRNSAEAYLALKAAGVPAHVVCAERLWDASTRHPTLARALQFLEVDWDEAPLRQAERHVDPWPRERRRTPPVALSPAHEEEFLALPGLARWREVFSADL